MRYLAGFIGGFVVAILLFGFQQHLIGGERFTPPTPIEGITLGSVTKPRPPEEKRYEARQPPPEPEVLEKPQAPVVTETAVERPRLPVRDWHISSASGTGVHLPPVTAAPAGDGSAVVTLPVEPQYPSRALLDGIEGEVEVEFTIRPDGRVADVSIIRATPPGVFESSARRAIERWQFMPRRENGVAVATRARQVIEFRLPAQ